MTEQETATWVIGLTQAESENNKYNYLAVASYKCKWAYLKIKEERLDALDIADKLGHWLREPDKINFTGKYCNCDIKVG